MMEKLYPWLEACHISEEQAKGWLSSLPQGETLLSWCLKTEKIKEDIYIEWAFKYYKLPLLKENYFESPLSQGQNFENRSPWSPYLIPVHQWEGTLFIACIEPPTHLELNKPFQFLLAFPSHLNRFWKVHHGEFPVISKNEVNLDFNKSTDNQLDLEKELNIKKEIKEESEDFDWLDAGSIVSAPNEFNPLETSQVTLIKEPLSNDFSEILSNDFKDKYHQENKKNSGNNPKIVKEITITNIMSSKTSEINLLDSLFIEMEQFFDKIMIFLLDKNNLTPWKWKGKWLPLADATNLKLRVDQPSIFRVPVQTRLPFHGKVYPNSINNIFFDSWNKSQIPNHATLSPIMTEDKRVIGLLMGLSQVTLQYHEGSLNKVDHLAKSIVFILENVIKHNEAA